MCLPAQRVAHHRCCVRYKLYLAFGIVGLLCGLCVCGSCYACWKETGDAPHFHGWAAKERLRDAGARSRAAAAEERLREQREQLQMTADIGALEKDELESQSRIANLKKMLEQTRQVPPMPQLMLP